MFALQMALLGFIFASLLLFPFTEATSDIY